MKNLFLPVLLAVACLSAAPLKVSTATFLMTLPDGWSKAPFGNLNDTTVFAMRGITDISFAILHGEPGDTTGVTLEDFLDGIEQVPDSGILLVDKGSKSLGSRTFAWAEYKSDPAAIDTSDENPSIVDIREATRYKLWVTAEGGVVFTAFLVYDSETSVAANTEMEAALSTMGFKPVTAIHRGAGKRFLTDGSLSSRGIRDLLGRSQAPVAIQPRKTFFPKP